MGWARCSDRFAWCLNHVIQIKCLGPAIEVRKFFGHALDFAQRGNQHDAAKVLKGFGGAGVLEVVENDVGGTYRAVYTVKFQAAVFVLHCFQKRSTSGIVTPKTDIDLIRARLKIAEALAKEFHDENSND